MTGTSGVSSKKTEIAPSQLAGGDLISPCKGSDDSCVTQMGLSPSMRAGSREDKLTVSPGMSLAFNRAAWGKSVMKRNLPRPDQPDHPDNRKWLPLVTHLYDTVGVAEHLWDSLISNQVKRAVCRAGGDMPLDRAHRIYLFLCGSHDIGKASPEFIYKNEFLHNRFHTLVPDLRADKPNGKILRHEVVSHYEMNEWIFEHGVGCSVSDLDEENRQAAKRVYYLVTSWGSVIGGHHGFMPTEIRGTFLDTPSSRDTVYSRRAASASKWRAARHAILDGIAERVGLTCEDAEWMSSRALFGSGQLLLCGMVQVADWVASTESLFELGPQEPPQMPDKNRVTTGTRKLNLPTTWEPTDALYRDFEATFAARFIREGSVEKFTPRPVQAALRGHVADKTPSHGAALIIVEDATGSGKTEAGLAAAEMLAHRSGSRGVMIALPTMATSNAMFSRVLSWLSRLGHDGRLSAQLLHSTSALNDEARALSRTGIGAAAADTALICCEDHGGNAVLHSWMTGRNRALLTDFAVGTIDVILGTALNRRHPGVPHFGLAQKVLVIDEVHDHDTYMRQFLLRVLQWCGANGVPVVALSATLTSKVRAELHRAYMGIPAETPLCDERLSAANTSKYPLITSSEHGPCTSVQSTSSITAVERRKEVEVDLVEGLLPEDIVSLVQRAAGDRGCVAVICNTVARAQKVFDGLANTMGEGGWEVELMHSRFTLADRMTKEKSLVGRLGNSVDAARPERYVLVGTQVLEQSLDVDFDMIVTDVCPASALIQRIGRLHRHTRTRPENHGIARLFVTGFSNLHGDGTLSLARGIPDVYGVCAPTLTAALLRDRTRITTPEDGPALVIDPHAREAMDRLPDSWREAYAASKVKELDRFKKASESASRWLIPPPSCDPEGGLTVGWTAITRSDDDDEFASVRDSVMDRTAFVVYRTGDSELSIRTEAEFVPVTGKAPIRRGELNSFKLTFARQEVKMPKTTSRIALNTLSDIREKYGLRWSGSVGSSIIDESTFVLELDPDTLSVVHIDDRGEAYRIRYCGGRGLEVSAE